MKQRIEGMLFGFGAVGVYGLCGGLGAMEQWVALVTAAQLAFLWLWLAWCEERDQHGRTCEHIQNEKLQEIGEFAMEIYAYDCVWNETLTLACEEYAAMDQAMARELGIDVLEEEGG